MIRDLMIATLLCAAAPAAFAAAPTCSANLEGSDAMKYNLANIDVSKTFTINLKHSGKLAKTVMGHNVIVAKASDMAAIDTDGMQAGIASDYVKAGDARVIGHSKVVGGGESTTMRFPVARLGAGPNAFFCSFPGHAAMMKGTITLTP